MIIDVNGQNMFAATGGLDANIDLGRQPSMVLIHGAGMDASVWQLQTRYLAHQAKAAGLGPVLAVDLPGHGRSDGPALDSVEAMADGIAEFLSRFGSDDGDSRPIVVGHSMGTFVALQLAASHPEAVDSVVLVATAAAMPVNPTLMTAASGDLPLAAALMSGWAHGSPAKTAPHPSPGMAMTAGARALIERSDADVLAVDLAACAAYDPLAAAPQLTCPVTVVSGRADKMTPARAARSLIEAIKPELVAAEVTLDCGHMTMSEAAGPLRVLLADLLTASRTL